MYKPCRPFRFFLSYFFFFFLQEIWNYLNAAENKHGLLEDIYKQNIPLFFFFVVFCVVSLFFFFSVAVKCTCQEESHIPRHAGFQDPRIRQDRSKRRLGVAAKLGLTKGVQAAQEAPAGGLGHIQGPHWVPDLQVSLFVLFFILF